MIARMNQNSAHKIDRHKNKMLLDTVNEPNGINSTARRRNETLTLGSHCDFLVRNDFVKGI